jgi:hypothetical protein
MAYENYADTLADMQNRLRVAWAFDGLTGDSFHPWANISISATRSRFV